MLKTRGQLISELEEIRKDFMDGRIGENEAKFRLTITRQAIQVHTLEILAQRFSEGMSSLQEEVRHTSRNKLLPEASHH